MMQNYVISEEFTLPSHGKVYPGKQVNEKIHLRSMTTNDEMRRLRVNERQFKSMAEVLDDCIIDEMDISTYDMCNADYQYLIHKLRVVTYGPEYPLTCTCPYCLSKQEETLNLDDLVYTDYSDEVQDYMEFDLPITGKHITLRMQTPHLADDVTVAANTDRRNRNNKDQAGFAFLYSIKYLIKEVDGEKLDSVQMDDLVLNLPMKDTNTIIRNIEKLNDSFGLVNEFEVTCNACGRTYTSPFRITSEFFGPSI